MKNLLIVFAILLASCSGDIKRFNDEENLKIYKIKHLSDSLVILNLTSAYDSLNKVYLNCELRCSAKDNRIFGLRDTLFYQSAQIANARKYLNICLKNPAQDRFLKGWIRRALE